MNNRIELLAPAGDLERAKTAIRFGADAVYLGGKRFSLRSRASNFDIEDIREACAFAKQYGSRIHVTVNMIPHEEDLPGIEEYLKQLEDAGVTAIIVASLSFIELAKRVAPKLEVHLSTQMSMCNADGIRFFEELGIDRAVLARECNLDHVRQIAKASPVPVEVFIHGGMCCNFSGRCTLSNAMTFRDANRGGCAQSCRWKYHVMNGEEEISVEEPLFSMSSKDLMAIEMLYDFMEADVASLKIEGRMKSSYYIASVVAAYRHAIDEVAQTGKPLSPERIAYYQKELSKAENRPFATGFYDHDPDENDHLYGVNGAGVTHDFVGVVMSYDEEKKIARVQSRNVFKVGDKLEVFGPHIYNEQFNVEHIVNKDGETIEVSNKPMEIVTIPLSFKVEEGDLIRRVHDDI
ncbi:MAG: U32 family peptidase [Erysipelotrichaceae bacterium]|nr:U32 family peptidase [Erysipelotrichaceae bacterium]